MGSLAGSLAARDDEWWPSHKTRQHFFWATKPVKGRFCVLFLLILDMNYFMNQFYQPFSCFSFVFHLCFICGSFVFHLFFICFSFVFHLFFMCFSFVFHLFVFFFTDNCGLEPFQYVPIAKAQEISVLSPDSWLAAWKTPLRC